MVTSGLMHGLHFGPFLLLVIVELDLSEEALGGVSAKDE